MKHPDILITSNCCWNSTDKTKVIDSYPYQLKLQDGNQYWKGKKYAESLNSFQTAVTEFDKHHKVIYPLLINMRILYNFLNNQDDRLHYYEQKLEYYQVNGPYQNIAPCYHGIAGYYLFKGAYNQAINYYLKGGEVFRKFDPAFYTNILCVVGNTYNQWGNFDKAGYYTKKALPIAEKLKDTIVISYCYSIMSHTAFDSGQYEEALKLTSESVRLLGKKPSQRLVGVLTYKAASYLKLNQPDLAFPILNEVRRMSDSASFKMAGAFGLTEIDYNFYEYYIIKNNVPLAEKSLLLAYKKAMSENGVPVELKYLKELGHFYQKQNKSGLSGKYFEEYFKVFDALEKGRKDFKVAQYEIDQNDKVQRDHINQLKQEKAVQEYELGRRSSHCCGFLSWLYHWLRPCWYLFTGN